LASNSIQVPKICAITGVAVSIVVDAINAMSVSAKIGEPRGRAYNDAPPREELPRRVTYVVGRRPHPVVPGNALLADVAAVSVDATIDRKSTGREGVEVLAGADCEEPELEGC
jgi:hypothetical protein